MTQIQEPATRGPQVRPTLGQAAAVIVLGLIAATASCVGFFDALAASPSSRATVERFIVAFIASVAVFLAGWVLVGVHLVRARRR